MRKNKKIIQFICYSPQIYSGFDKFNLVLAEQLKEKGIDSVFVFSDKIGVQKIADDLLATGVTVELISSRNKLTIFLAVVKIFFRYRPVIVHAHFVNYIQMLVAMLSCIFGAGYFITFHSVISLLSVNDYRKKKGILKQFVLKLYYRFLIAVSQKVLCVSSAIENQFRAFSDSNSKKIQSLCLGVKVQPNAKSKKQLRSILSLPDDYVLICNVSAVEPVKGLDILINAVGILKDQYHLTHFKCFHIGGLRSETKENILYREELFQQIKNLQLENEFLWLGQRNDINEILSAFDIYTHPSRSEGVPVAIMEACAQSLPAVGTRVGGIPEIIKPDENGYLVPPESAEELADVLNDLIQNRELRERMGNESLRIVGENFNVEKQTNLLFGHYSAVL